MTLSLNKYSSGAASHIIRRRIPFHFIPLLSLVYSSKPVRLPPPLYIPDQSRPVSTHNNTSNNLRPYPEITTYHTPPLLSSPHTPIPAYFPGL